MGGEENESADQSVVLDRGYHTVGNDHRQLADALGQNVGILTVVALCAVGLSTSACAMPM